MDRRQFLQTAATLPLLNPSRILGANDRIRVGFIGLGGRALWLMSYDVPGTEIVAVADCCFPRCDRAIAKYPERSARWKKYPSHRAMLDNEKLDAVFVETTTHARAFVAMEALQAGLDVYAEKPLTLTVSEGRTLVNAVRKHNRVLQTGTQQRSIPINHYGSQLVREGAIGKIKSVVVCNLEPGKTWIPKPAQPMPEGLNWDLWCNQTELRPYHHDLQFGWGEWWDYDGGGQSWGVTGWGAHSLDQVQCALGTDDTGPVEVWPEAPGEDCKITMRYANGTLLKLEGPHRDHADLGGIFHGENGYIEIRRGSISVYPYQIAKGAPDPTPEGPGEDLFHLKNFFECMRTRQKPNADVEIGHRATTLCHLTNICRKLQRKLQWDPVAEKFVGDPQANALLSRPRRHGYELPAV